MAINLPPIGLNLPQPEQKKCLVVWTAYIRWMKVLTEACRSVRCDFITGIPRGGLIPAVLLSHELGKPYTPFETVHRDLHRNKRVLVVDDILDTGRTYKDYVWMTWPSVCFAVVIDLGRCDVKPFASAVHFPSAHAEFKDDWIVLPYEKECGNGPSEHVIK